MKEDSSRRPSVYRLTTPKICYYCQHILKAKLVRGSSHGNKCLKEVIDYPPSMFGTCSQWEPGKDFDKYSIE